MELVVLGDGWRIGGREGGCPWRDVCVVPDRKRAEKGW